MNFTEFLVRALSQTERWVQACVVLGIAGLTGFQFVWSLWERRQNQRIRRERDEFRFKYEHGESQLASAEKRADAERLAKDRQFAELKVQADRDREVIRSAIPAFERVIRQNEALRERYETGQTQIRRLETNLTDFQKIVHEHQDLRAQFEEACSRAERLQVELADFRKRSDDLRQIDADIWIGPSAVPDRPPPFVYREQRKTRFVTFLNLKGGVGKTTIAVNLAAAYATGVLGRKLKVLAVDLDLQGTLGNLCVERQLLIHQRSTQRTAAKLLDRQCVDRGESLLTDLVVPMTGTAEMAGVIVADERLDQIDFRQQAVYAMQQAEVRFCHRQFFHQSFITGRYDLVFFDCPPRLTTSSLNALAASDWIVVPTALDPNDVEAVPRTLVLLQKLQQEAKVDFHTNLGGVILNSTYYGGTAETLTVYETDTFALLKQGISRFVPGEEAILKHTIKDDSSLLKAAAEQVPFGAAAKGRDFFRGVAEELYQRIKN